MSAKILSESGLKVIVLEAGSDYDPSKEEYRTQLRWPWESPHRGAGTKRPLEILMRVTGMGYRW